MKNAIAIVLSLIGLGCIIVFGTAIIGIFFAVICLMITLFTLCWVCGVPIKYTVKNDNGTVEHYKLRWSKLTRVS